MRITLLCCVVIFCRVSGFVIRSPQPQPVKRDSGDYSLAEALRVLEREKRRLEDEVYNRGWSEDDDNTNNRFPSPGRLMSNQGSDRGIYDGNGDEDDDGGGGGGYLGNMDALTEYVKNVLSYESEDDNDGDDNNDDVDGDGMDNLDNELGYYYATRRDEIPARTYASNVVPASHTELDDIFRSDEIDDDFDKKKKKKKRVPPGLKMKTKHKKSEIEAVTSEAVFGKLDPELDTQPLSQKQIQILLDEVNNMENQEVLDDVENDINDIDENIRNSLDDEDVDGNYEESIPVSEPVPVSDDELNDVFSDDDTDNGDDDDESLVLQPSNINENENDNDDDNNSDNNSDKDTNRTPYLNDYNLIKKRQWTLDKMYENQDGYIFDDRRKRNVKRADRQLQIAPTGSTSAEPEVNVHRLLTVLAKMRLRDTLENREIDYLADSLNYATNSQVDQNVASLKRELSSLEHAINVEEALEKVNGIITDDDKKYMDTVLEQYLQTEGRELLKKKKKKSIKRSGEELLDTDLDEIDFGDIPVSGSPTVPESLGNWYNQQPRIEPSTVDVTVDEEAVDQESVMRELAARIAIQEVLASMPSQDEVGNLADPDYVDDDVLDEVKDDIYDVIDGGDEDNDEDEAVRTPGGYSDAINRLFDQDEVDPATQSDIENTLQQYVSNVQPWQRRELEDKLVDYVACPALDTLSSNCDIADRLEIPIDQEARDLCSRHESCYSCGGMMEKSPSQCDAGYMADAIRLCEESVPCVKRAASFLKLMQYVHKYSALEKSACAQECVFDFMYGVKK